MWVASTVSDPLVQWLTQAGPVGMLAMGLVAFFRGWIVSGREAQRLREERDRALDLVYRQAGLANRAVDLSRQRLELEQKLLALRRQEEAAADEEIA